MTTHFTTGKLAPKNAKLGFRIHLLAFVVLTPIIWLVWYLTDTTYPWPLWSTPAWAVGVIFHYLGVYAFGKKHNNTL